MDPVKASETPVARGSGVSKKRSLLPDDNTPIQSKKAKSISAGAEASPVPMFHQQHASPDLHAQQMHASSSGEPYQAHMAEAQLAAPSNGHAYHQHHQLEEHDNAALEPMFAFPAHTDTSSYVPHVPHVPHSYSFAASERPYMMQSLEQIASEVLDMNADYQDHHEAQPMNSAPMPHGLPMDRPDADESIDSGVSLPGSESMEVNGTHSYKEDAADMTNEQSSALAAYQVPGQGDAKAAEHSSETAASIAAQALSTAQNPSISSLPLFRPPAPLSQSPEQSRRLPNGIGQESPVQTNGHKRKRSSMSQTSQQVMPSDLGLEA